MKAEILSIMRSRKSVVSGEALSAALGISRVSVWKHIQKLRGYGYQIEATATGYRLAATPDVLFPWEFKDRADKIVYHPEIGSTMDAAKALAREGCEAMTVVVAEKQSSGRGRLQRPWFSDPGGLYFTMVLRPNVPVLDSYKIGFLASVTMAQLLGERFAIDARLKWPNDIMVDGAKLCGMLAEMEAETDRLVFLNIGMGINVNNHPPRIDQAVVSLKNLVGREISRRRLLAAYLDKFEQQMAETDLKGVVAEWKKYTMTLGQAVKIVTANSEFLGVAEDIDDTGALLVRQVDGSLERVIYGDCFLQ